MNLSQNIPNNEEQDLFRSPILKIRGKCLFFGNVIYQIHNISSIEFVNLTTERKIPLIHWGLISFGIVIFLGSISSSSIGLLIGLIFLSIGGYLIYKHNRNKIDDKYGMTIYTNSGKKSILTSKKKDFIFRAILTLSNVMNTDESTALTMNFSNYEILSDKFIQMDKNIYLPIFNGKIQGDLISNLEHLINNLEQELSQTKPQPKKSLLGLCEDLGKAPSAAEIDNIRNQSLK